MICRAPDVMITAEITAAAPSAAPAPEALPSEVSVDEVLLAVLLFRVIFAPWPESEPFEKIEVTLARASSSSSSISSSS